jgi:DNA-binding SARP family transcriptional activator/ABC-type transport system substrate-binding protein
VDFRILGPLEVVVAGRGVPLGGAKQRAALAMLLLHRNQTVSRDRLIEGLWGEEPPASAGHTLEAYVSRLRRALLTVEASPRLMARPPGYVLKVEAGELDLDRFQAALDRAGMAISGGDPSAAAAALREALAMFRGAPLEDLTYAPFAQGEIPRLEELRLAAVERRIDADLACGRHRELVGELESLVARHPLRERFWAQLMLALYRSGRQGEALGALERARSGLAEELGVDPSPVLTEVQQGILRQDPGLAPAQPRVALPTIVGRKGRDAELKADESSPVPRPSRRPAVDGRGPAAPGEPGRRPFMTRRPARTGLIAVALVALVALVAVFVPRILNQGRAGIGTSSRPGLNFLDARTGEVVGHLPIPVTSEVHYADGVFWDAKGSQTSASVSFVAIDARTRRVLREFASPVDDVGGFTVDGNDLWVTSYPEPVLVRMDARSGRVEDRIPLSDPSAPRFSGGSYGARQLVVAAGSVWVGRTGEVVQVNPQTGRVVRRFPLPYAWGIGFGEGRVWVSTKDGLTWIDPRTSQVGPTAPITTPQYVTVGAGAAWTEDGLGTVYKVGLDGRVLATYRTADGGAGDTKVDFSGGTVWEGNASTGTVTAIDALTGDRRTYRFPDTIGDLAAGAGLVVVPMGTEPTTQQVFAHLTGNVGRFVWPSYTADPPDPAVADIRSNPWMAQVERATCAMLMNYPDQAGVGGARLQPEIAAGMPEVSADGRTYVFTIRPGYRFSPPSNQPVTAEAVRYSIERALSPKLGVNSPGPQVIADIAGEHAFRDGRAAHISGMRAAGDRLTIKLTRPSPDFLDRLSLPFFCVVPAGTPIVPQGVAPAPPTAGPYYMARWNNGEYLILKRNPDYQGPRPHFFDAFIFREGMDPGLAVGHVGQGVWDHISLDDPLLAPGGAVDQKWGQAGSARTPRGPRYLAEPLPVVHYIAFNAGRSLFANRRLRLGVARALNRGALAQIRDAIPTDQLLPPTAEDYHDRAVFPLDGDLASARALVHQRRATATMAVQAGCKDCLQVAQAVAAQLAPLGIEVRLRTMQDTSAAAVARAPVDLVESTTSVPYPDGASFLSRMLVRDIPRSWLPPGVRARAVDLASSSGHRWYAAAVTLADDLATGAVPAAAFSADSMGELFGGRIGCEISAPPGSGIDLPALCLSPSP